MTVTGQTGIFGYGMQSAKGTLATSWYRHFVNDVNFGPIQDLRSFPLEVGSVVVPTGGYKGGVFMGGGASLQPRLEGDFGWLMKGLMGLSTDTPGTASPTAVHAAVAYNATSPVTTSFTAPPQATRLVLTGASVATAPILITSIVGTDDNGTALTDSATYTMAVGATTLVTAKEFKTVTSITFTAVGTTAGTFSVGFYQSNTHVFGFNTDPTVLPWMSVRKKVPGTTSFGETGQDCRMTGMRLNFPQNGLLTTRVDFVGRQPIWEEGATVDNWAFVSTFEDYTSVPATCVVNGYIKLPNFSGTALPITSLAVTMANNFTSPQQEAIVGSPYPDDFAVISRGMMFNAVLKWSDQTLYKKLLMDGSLNWNPAPFFSDFQAKIFTPGNMPLGSAPYSIQVDAGSVMWQPQSAPVPAGGGIIMLPLVGQVMNPTSGAYGTFTVVNGQIDYN